MIPISSPLVISSQGNSLILEAREGSLLQGRRDANVYVVVESAGFRGHGEVWIGDEDIEAFLAAARQLYNSLRGTAVLNSMSPDELRIDVYTTDGLGHLALKASVMRSIGGAAKGPFVHLAAVAFSIELSHLKEIIDWFEQI